MTPPTSTEHGQRPLMLLSLDGGGIRGLSSILILKEIMRQVNREKPVHQHVEPWQVFDLIGGTSTGGIIAAMLGRLRMTLDECQDAYLKLGKEIFTPKRSRVDGRRLLDFAQADEKFDSKILESCMKTIIKQKTGDENSPLKAPGTRDNEECKVFVTSILERNSQPVYLRSYEPGKLADPFSHDFALWQALRATSAASTFFDPYQHGETRFVDGGFAYNNPVLRVMIEASDLWGAERPAFLISIGTGESLGKSLEGNLKKLTQRAVKMTMQTERTAEDFYASHRPMVEAGMYYRFNVPNLTTVGMQEYKEVETIKAFTSSYLIKAETGQQLAAAAHKIHDVFTTEKLDVSEVSISQLDLVDQQCIQALFDPAGDYDNHRAQLEHPVEGTCSWILQHEKFQAWLNSDEPSLLWITGNPACGKSILARFIADTMEAAAKDTANAQWAPIVCPFFFKDGLEKRDNCRSAVSALLHRLFTARPLLSRLGREEYAAKGSGFTLSPETTWHLMCEACSEIPQRHVICVIDALDECSEESRNRFIRLMLNTFSSENNPAAGCLKVLVTSRPWPEIEAQFGSNSTIRLRGEDETNAVANDLDIVIAHRVNELRNKHILTHETSVVVEKMLRDKADGTFLWISLVLESIASIRSRKLSAIEKKLSSLPKTLDELYSQALLDTDDEDEQEMTQQLLSILLAATRSLTLDEINICLSLHEDTKWLSRLELEPDIAHTVKTFGGFFVRVVHSEVLLVHQTAREYLLKEGTAIPGKGWKHSISILDANCLLARRCLRWLLLHDWVSFVEDTMASQSREDIVQRMVAVLPQGQKGFFLYATFNWSTHVKALGTDYKVPPELHEAMLAICDFSRTSFSLWWSCYSSTKSFGNYSTQSIFRHAASKGDLVVLQAMWEGNSLPANGDPVGSAELLRVAAYDNHIEVLKWVFSLFSLENLDAGDALMSAVERCHYETVESIVENTSTNINSDRNYDTALAVAARQGDLAIVRLLTAHGADTVDSSAFQRAVENYTPGVLEFLLEQISGNDIIERAEILQKALEAAIDGKMAKSDLSPTGYQYYGSLPTSSILPFQLILKNGLTLPPPHDMFFHLVEASRNDMPTTIIRLFGEGAHDKHAVALILASRSPKALCALLEHHAYDNTDIWKAFRYMKSDIATFCRNLLVRRVHIDALARDSILFTHNPSIPDEEECLRLFLRHLIGIQHSVRLEPIMRLLELAHPNPFVLKPVDVDMQVARVSLEPPKVRSSLLTLATICKADVLARALAPTVDINDKDTHGMTALLAAGLAGSEDLIDFSINLGARSDIISWYTREDDHIASTAEAHSEGQAPNALHALSLVDFDHHQNCISTEEILHCWGFLWDVLGKDGFIESPRSLMETSEVESSLNIINESHVREKLAYAKGFEEAGDFASYKLLYNINGRRLRYWFTPGEGNYDFFDEVPHSLVLPYLKSASGQLEGRSALHLAAQNGMTALMNVLLARGLSAAAVDDAGQTPLHLYAVGFINPQLDAMSSMIEGGASIDAIDNEGRTPLHLSVMNGYGWTKQAAMLIDLGATINAKDASGSTPLHLSLHCAQGFSSIVTFLLEKGADSLAKDSEGLTALQHIILRLPKDSYGKKEIFVTGMDSTINGVKALVQGMVKQGWSLSEKQDDGLTIIEFTKKVMHEDAAGDADRLSYLQTILDLLQSVPKWGHSGLDQDDIRKFYENEQASASAVKERKASLDESFWNDVSSADELDLGSSDGNFDGE